MQVGVDMELYKKDIKINIFLSYNHAPYDAFYFACGDTGSGAIYSKDFNETFFDGNSPPLVF